MVDYINSIASRPQAITRLSVKINHHVQQTFLKQETEQCYGSQVFQLFGDVCIQPESAVVRRKKENLMAPYIMSFKLQPSYTSPAKEMLSDMTSSHL